MIRATACLLAAVAVTSAGVSDTCGNAWEVRSQGGECKAGEEGPVCTFSKSDTVCKNGKCLCKTDICEPDCPAGFKGTNDGSRCENTDDKSTCDLGFMANNANAGARCCKTTAQCGEAPLDKLDGLCKNGKCVCGESGVCQPDCPAGFKGTGDGSSCVNTDDKSTCDIAYSFGESFVPNTGARCCKTTAQCGQAPLDKLDEPCQDGKCVCGEKGICEVSLDGICPKGYHVPPNEGCVDCEPEVECKRCIDGQDCGCHNDKKWKTWTCDPEDMEECLHGGCCGKTQKYVCKKTEGQEPDCKCTDKEEVVEKNETPARRRATTGGSKTTTNGGNEETLFLGFPATPVLALALALLTLVGVAFAKTFGKAGMGAANFEEDVDAGIAF